ncbi:hypothetical protein ACIGXM_19100 [Kitasatospora sp. NPDC052896]|uniref:hypothetical protein n=1 Tax=Kitasatospora sp. NPDC052896 TaxID=3364061 RepID=UPI0037C54D56
MFGQRCHGAGIRASTGRTGSCFDDAVTESLLASPETELIDRTTFPTHHHAKQTLFAYVARQTLWQGPFLAGPAV